MYERLKRRVPARLLVGPWTHVAASTGPGLPRNGVPALTAIELRWFDHWLYGMNTHVKRIPRVTQFSYGRDRYVTERDWPNPRLAPKRRYLRGAGALRPRPPADDEAPQTFLQNPTAGICTQSTAQWTGGLGEPIPCTQDGNAEGAGAATYTTPPLARRLELSGPILASLWVRTSASEAVVTVRVKDVAPDGSATELTAGWLSGSASALGGRVEVLTDPRHRSYVELPALRRHCGGHCKPLPVPELIRGG